MGSNKKAIITTLIYSDIFNFPLTEEELYYYLQASKPISQVSFKKELYEIRKDLDFKDGFFTLPGRIDSINRRKKIEQYYEEKMLRAKQIAWWLSVIPGVYFIGVSGSVAVKNAEKDDDIDFFVITKHNTLFSSRFLMLCFLEAFGVRRRRNEPHAQGKICLNMIVDDDALETKEEFRDLYTAREIAQLYPLVDKANTYGRYFNANSWIHSFLPHVKKRKGYEYKKIWSLGEIFLTILEPIMKRIQLVSISKHTTNEIIKDNFLAFHPTNTREKVGKEYLKKIAKYEKYYK